MSHVATVQVAFTDQQHIATACEQIGATFDPTVREVQLYGRQTILGRTIQLKGWHYPCVISPDGRTLSYDNMNGAWGDIAKLNQFKVEYTSAASLAEFSADLDMTSVQRELLQGGPHHGWTKITADIIE